MSNDNLKIMNQFDYIRPTKPDAVVQELAKNAGSKIIAGGTNLLDLMKRGVIQPDRLVDINRLQMKSIELAGNQLTIGTLAPNSDVAADKNVRAHSPLLSQALLAGASPQLRNMATTGGNMMQRTRCGYFYDITTPCNKREPGSGCSALGGYNRMHAIFGASEKCIAVHPSDMCVALVALDATVVVSGPKGERRIPFGEFHRLPGDMPEKDNTLVKDELIQSVLIPAHPFTQNTHYLKIRDRTSYAFALISVAAALQLDGQTIKDARLGMGGVAHKPWRLTEAETFLKGKTATKENFRQAADLAMKGAKTYEHNAFKIKMGGNAIVEALTQALKG